MTDLVLALHSHLPWVLHHGRWPHGSDWLCEAALDTYLPLLEALEALERDDVAAPLTIGVTPVLANQLAHPAFRAEMEAFFDQRLASCAEAPAALVASGDGALVPLVGWWRARFERLRALFERHDGDLVRALRGQADRGRIELMGSAATHGFLPLLSRDESIRLQLAVGVAEHQRLFGRRPAGCWVPECAYRPRGPWEPIPGLRRRRVRQGTDEHLAAAGFRYFFADAHQAHAGLLVGASGDPAVKGELPDVERRLMEAAREALSGGRSPYRAYRVGSARTRGVAAFVRDPRTSLQVWSRHFGYPGDPWYLEFHKIRWPGGLKLWRVTEAGGDLGRKLSYVPERAGERARAHADHLAGVMEGLAIDPRLKAGGVIASPFDTELFGHWWAEGVEFLEALYRRLAGSARVRPVSASRHLHEHPPRLGLRLAEGSWGANGDFSMWLNPGTRWTWERLWPLEDWFWDAAPAALERPDRHAILSQAARSLLLAQSSDWQFIISTAVAADYAERRFAQHCDDLALLVGGLSAEAPESEVARARAHAAAIAPRDDLFPDIVASVRAALA